MRSSPDPLFLRQLMPTRLCRTIRRCALLGAGILALGLALLPVSPALGAGGPQMDEVLRVLNAEFEAHDRLQPDHMLEGALRAAGEAVPALLVERRSTAYGTNLRLRIGTHQAEISLSGLTTLQRLKSALDEVSAFIMAVLPPAERPGNLQSAFAEGLLSALDDHAALLSASAYGDFQSRASGRIGGLGMLLVQHSRHLTVDAVLPDSPAARAGVSPGDRLLQIGEHTALHLPVEEALGLVRGRVGTLVSLLILRPGESAPRQLVLRRSNLHFASVESDVLREHGRERIAHIRLRSFQETTTAELREHLQQLRVGSPGLIGIVLDLRDNPGGVLEQAIRVADLFLERGTIVSMRGPRIKPESVPARWYRSVSSAPLVVLINRGTASAAELVAGALKQNHRALLMGEPSFGKNSVQSVFPLSDGSALKLTVARFFPVGRRSIEGTGVVPHIRLQPVLAPGDVLHWRGLLATATGVTALPDATGSLNSPPPLREVPYLRDGNARQAETDYALDAALRLLRLNAPQGPSVLLRTALAWAQQERRLQDQRIAERITATGLDWRPGNGGIGGQVELLRATLEQREGPHAPWAPVVNDESVQGGRQVRLTLTLRNAGALPLHRVLARTESEASYLDGLELPVGLVSPGRGQVHTSVIVNVPPRIPQGSEPVRVRFYDGRRQLHYLATLFIPQAGTPAARLRVSLAAFDNGTGGSRGNGDGRPQAGEVVALRVRLDNAGRSASGQGRYWLGGASLADDPGMRAWQSFDSMAPGHGVEQYLRLPVEAAAGSGASVLTLNVMSDHLTAPELSWSFRLTPGQPLPQHTLQAPMLSLSPPLPLKDEGSVQLHGIVQDDLALRDVRVYRNGRKVQFATPEPGSGATAELRLQVPVVLEPGRNLVRVVARNADGLESVHTYVLWRGKGHGFPIAGLSSDGA